MLAALSLVASGCTATSLTRASDPRACLAFVAEPDWHHGFEGRGTTHAFLASGDTLTVWAARGVHERYSDLGDSVAVYTRPFSTPFYDDGSARGDDRGAVVVALPDVRGTERRWTPYARYGEATYLLGGAAGLWAGWALVGGDEASKAGALVALGAGVAGGVGAAVLPSTFRRVDRCEVVPNRHAGLGTATATPVALTARRP